MNSKRIIVLVLVAIGAITTHADAALVKFEFTGTLTYVPPTLSASFSIGQPFALSYIFDTNAPLTNGTQTTGPGFAKYAATAFTAAAGTHSIYAPNAEIRVSNDYTIDEYNCYPLAGSWTVGGVPIGFTHTMTEIQYTDNTTLTGLTDTYLPDDPADLSGMTSLFRISFLENGVTTRQVLGTVGAATVTPAPEPATLSLLAVGALAMLRRRRSIPAAPKSLR